MSGGGANKRASRVTEQRAKAQRAKLDTQAEARQLQKEKESSAHQMQNKKKTRQDLQAKRRLIETLIDAYIQDHIGGNHSEKTLEWHRTALGLMCLFLQSELINLRVDDLDRKHGVITVLGKGSKERRVALGQNCLRNVLYYLDKYRPDEEELADWGSTGEDHLFLSETRQPLTKNGMEMLFKRLKARAGIVGKRISPHILRHTFAINYLVKSNDPFSLQELLGHEDLTTVQNYMHMNDALIQDQKRKYSPGDHIPARMPGPREIRPKVSQTKEQRKRT